MLRIATWISTREERVTPSVEVAPPARARAASKRGAGRPADSTGARIPPKQIQINPNKKAWISLVLFVGIGPFQRVTAIPNKKIHSRLRLCAKCLKGSALLSPGRLACTAAGSISGEWESHSVQYHLILIFATNFVIGGIAKAYPSGCRFGLGLP
jgi:hypothetical protein